MQKFTTYCGNVVPLNIANVDTDAIIPKQFLQKITRTGFGAHLFHDWRFLDLHGLQTNPNFVLNEPRYQHAAILLVKENFGCGSSREHAPWALADYGFRVIIGSSFADIFYNNAFNNQLLLITLPEETIAVLFDLATQEQALSLTVDLEKQTVSTAQHVYSFQIDPFKRHCLLNGLDSIGLTLQHQQQISDYEENIAHFLS